MSKYIVFCADGTWNGPDQDDDDDNKDSEATNVYKLFLCLDGDDDEKSKLLEYEQEKRLQINGVDVQVAKYIHGVGDGNNPIKKMLGGIFGAGTIARIVRGYTFISREYNAGDHIVIVGFSRGAYTARALADMIATQGLLAKPLTSDNETAYEWGARAWYHYRRDSGQGNWWTRLVGGISDLPAFLTESKIDPAKDLVPVNKIKSVAVWDTVGSLGFPRYDKENRADVFQFANTQLSDKVENGIHAIALDEQRADFTPTLWHQADNVEQWLFSGAHADVGGGYPEGEESHLSNIPLVWMLERLKQLEVSLSLPNLTRNAAGISHKPWQHFPFKEGRTALRDFKGKGLSIHDSIRERIKQSPVVQEPNESPEPYDPINLP